MNRTKIFTFALIILTWQLSFAQNPILRDIDSGFLYVADPAAEVFNGKVYVYCSHDQPDAENYEGMKDYVILESSDMKNWVNHGVSLDPQLDAGFEYAQSNMNAPDAAYKDGWYYWYFPSDITYVGVAKSRSPVGPWESAVTNEITTIFDPTVFVDDDGQAYIYGNDHWVDIGEPGSYVMGAKLKDNMIELDGPWIRLSKEVVNEAVHVFKRNGIYYFNARVGGVTQYWMADSPLPQYATFKGELAPNSPHSPNHVSAIELRLNSPTGTLVGTIPVDATGGWNNYKTLSITLNGIRGAHTLYLCYTGGSENLFNLNWFEWTPPTRKALAH